MSELRTLTFEIGTEEIPAFDLHRATEQLHTLVPSVLDAQRIPYESVKIFTTPRRLIMIVEKVAAKTEALEEVFRGPSAKIAFDENGEPTKAAIGFARGKGLGVEALERREEKGVEYVFVSRTIPSRDVASLLPSILREIIDSISWPKSCRWGTTSEYFSRPVRWLLALLGDEIIPVEFAGLTASNLTCGHRFLSLGPHTVAHADELLNVLRASHVVCSEEEREQVIREGVAQVEAETGAVAELPAKTLLEVTNLCEQPTVLVGTFDESFLQVPEEIIVDAMLMHQRYFPLYDANHRLINKFIVVSNGNPDYAANIIDGNERVVRARLSDAQFFYEEDLKRPLDSYVDRLDEVVFQETLGTMRAKVGRLVSLSEHLAKDGMLSSEDAADVSRAAYLAKADLVTNTVVEFTSVQGVMGSYYAEAAGETKQVFEAISDHYRPRYSGDELPRSTVGMMVACADKLDTICGLFAVGQGPTGSSDPFALRRSAIGIIAMLEAGLPISLVSAIEAALDAYAQAGISFDFEAVKAEIVDFFVTRVCVALRERGIEADTVDAVLASGVKEPFEIIDRACALESARKNEGETFENLAIAYARANNLRDEAAGVEVDENLLTEVEHALLCAIAEAERKVSAALERNNFAQAVADLAALRKPIDLFFDSIMVMDEDLVIRRNRMSLLNRFVGVFSNVADFGKMAKSGK